jgi:type I restriction enzyme, S subunit
MKKYDKYKDSGIEWIGEIPEHWGVKRFKHSFKFINEKCELDLPKIGLEHIESWTGKRIENNTDFEGDGTCFQINDILFGKLRPYLAKVFLSDFIGKAVGDFFVFRPEESIYPKFGHKFLLSRNFIEITNSSTFGSKMPRVSPDFINEIKITLPPLPEQTAIAKYLDRKTAEIDELIADKKRLLELYEEEKTAIINQAVTKGINPDVKMKDSGIEWLGEIPEHWDINKLSKVVSKITNGYVGPVREVMQSDGIPYIQGIHIKNGTVEFTPNGNYYVSKKWSDNHAKSILVIGDVLVVQTGTIGDVGIVPKEFDGANCHALLILRAKSEIIYPEYLLKVLSSRFGYNSLQLIKTGEILHHINGSKLKGVDIPIAPLSEQQAIVHHIEKECTRIDAKKSRTEKLIELLTEYRTALISEVVTGKIKVTE